MILMSSAEHPFSWPAIIRLITAGIILYFMWQAANILVVILIAVMLATAFYPLVVKLSTKIPLTLAAILAMLILLVPFILIGASVIPHFIKEFPHLVETVNHLVKNSTILPESVRTIDVGQYAQSAGKYALQSTSIITNIVTSSLIVLFLTFYLIVDAPRIVGLLLGLVPTDRRSHVQELLDELAQINGQYIRGNLIISAICGVTIFLGLLALGIPFAMPIAIFTAIMDLLPLIGSTIGLIPALVLGFSISPLTGVLVIILYLAYQQIEGAIISPAIYNKALKLSPSLSFLAVIIGSALFGIVGSFLALPIAASLPALISFIRGDADTSQTIITQKKRSLKSPQGWFSHKTKP